ncbi:hypothetical protein AT959_05405 [Dechloromonas denitrificans]|uniref:Uncharacterized protein n=1 Tax=Dechloromonas denitrificans TaxID=281362 RepID=A0A133XLH1_9RHOO|nr:hypothetical protein [Dechloromonas denitrificans]KXB31785.1 hypothetical protein AT959_05405 [Dechloromonas denitrificans]
MKNDETSSRKPALHRATEIGCTCWTPIQRPVIAAGQEHPENSFALSAKPESVAESASTIPLKADLCRPKDR